MSKFERLAVFTKVIETQGFTSAAKQLGVSTAAVSKQISKLEEEVGIQLIHRSTRRFEMTEPGLLYYENCKRLVTEFEQTEKLVSNLHREPSGNLRVVAARYFGDKYVVPYLKEFIRLYPKVRLDLELSERMPDLPKEGIDVLLGVSMMGPDPLIQKQIAKTRYAFCASPEYLEIHGVPQKPVDLRQHLYITHKMRRSDHLVEFSKKTQIRVEPILRLNDTRAMLECALSGIGIAQLHHYVVSEALAEGKLIEVLNDYVKPEIPVYLYYQGSRFIQPKVRKFIEFFCQRIE